MSFAQVFAVLAVGLVNLQAVDLQVVEQIDKVAVKLVIGKAVGLPVAVMAVGLADL